MASFKSIAKLLKFKDLKIVDIFFKRDNQLQVMGKVLGIVNRAISTYLRSPLQTILAWEEDDYGNDQLGRIGGFSLHAGVAVNTRERKKLERICLGAPAFRH